MGILNNSEEDKIKSAISSGDIVISTVARLYKAVSGSWDYTSKWGGIVLVKEDKAHFLKIVNLDNSNVEWTQELYDGFNYEKSKPFLHVFEGDDAVYGLSFADESDANSFHSKVSAAAPGSSSSSSSTRQPPSRAPPLNLNPRGPPAALSPSTSPRSTHSPAEESNSSPAAVDSPSADDAPAKTKKTKRGFGGFMGTVRKYKGKITGEEKEDIEVSKPRDFRHLSSIGWTPENGFEIRNIPPEWRKLFQQAGVKKSELQDAETAAFVMDIIQKEGGFETLAAEAEKNESNDNSNANEDAPTTTAPSAPPAPPPMPNAPAPPPMPAGRIAGKSAGGGGAPRGGLLDQIKQGKELQKVEPPAESAPAPTAGLADTLAKAMAARRGNMMQGPSKSNVLADDSDDDSWED